MDANFISQPHDAFFKLCLQDREIAEAFLEGCLPAEIRQRCDFSSLRLQSASFIESDFSAHHADLLYGVKIDDRQGFVYFLLEHQSTPDRWMALRMQRYMTSIFKYAVKRFSSLPVVVPLVVYAGKISPYPYSWDLMDCFQDVALARSVFLVQRGKGVESKVEDMLFRAFFLIDLTVLSDEELSKLGKGEVVGTLLKKVEQRDIFSLLGIVFEICYAHGIKGEILSIALRYIAARKAYEGDNQTLLAFLNKKAEKYQYKEEVMTFAESLMQEGMEKGLEKGAWETSHKIARNLLLEGADEAFVMRVTGLDKDDLEALKASKLGR